MAYEVVKRVGARAYRYSVESFRDPATKKVRSRWTYLGRAAAAVGSETTPKRRAPGQMRERLIDAYERLVEAGSAAGVSAGTVATEAGVAHGTFYRYFADKRAILVAALERVRDEFERASPTFGPPFGTRTAERARVRAWTQAICRHLPARAGVLRAWHEALETDPELREQRVRRRLLRVGALRDYLKELADAGIVFGVHPEPLATALVTLIEATFRESVAASSTADAALVEGVIELFDRAIFGVEAGGAATSTSTLSATGSRSARTVK